NRGDAYKTVLATIVQLPILKSPQHTERQIYKSWEFRGGPGILSSWPAFLPGRRLEVFHLCVHHDEPFLLENIQQHGIPFLQCYITFRRWPREGLETPKWSSG